MIDLIIGFFGGNQLMAALAAIVGLVATAFGFSWKMRGKAIEDLSEEVKIQEGEKANLEQAIITQTDTTIKVEKANEILVERSNVDESSERLRKRIRARSNSNKD